MDKRAQLEALGEVGLKRIAERRAAIRSFLLTVVSDTEAESLLTSPTATNTLAQVTQKNLHDPAKRALLEAQIRDLAQASRYQKLRRPA